MKANELLKRIESKSALLVIDPVSVIRQLRPVHPPASFVRPHREGRNPIFDLAPVGRRCPDRTYAWAAHNGSLRVQDLVGK
jgi:hypothetical protein